MIVELSMLQHASDRVDPVTCTAGARGYLAITSKSCRFKEHNCRCPSDSIAPELQATQIAGESDRQLEQSRQSLGNWTRCFSADSIDVLEMSWQIIRNQMENECQNKQESQTGSSK